MSAQLDFTRTSTQQMHLGDCLDIMRTFPDNSIEFIVTDPPYGLNFMGKGWDHQIPPTQYWQEMLRICKPGAMLAAFGGSRTHHHLMMALENSGWEIRDVILWLYGQGFPKSHNHFGLSGYGTALKPAHEIVMICQKPLSLKEEQNIIVENLRKIWCQLCLMLPVNVAKQIFTSNNLDMNAALDFAHINANQKSCIQEDLYALMDMLRLEKVIISCLNIVSSWKIFLEDLWKDGSMSIIKTKINQIIDLKTLNYYLSQLTPLVIIQEEIKQPGSWSNVLPAPKYLNAVLKNISAIHELSALENVIEKDGLNLCPNYEPIILAMKPIDGTYAQNAQKWGLAGINIDDSRIGNDEIKTNGENKFPKLYGKFKTATESIHKGRWPANIILDESAAQMLDQQSGHLVGAGNKIGSERKQAAIFENPRNHINYKYDNGGAASRFFKIFTDQSAYEQAEINEIEQILKEIPPERIIERKSFEERLKKAQNRFFYCAKASSSERNKGCENFPLVKINGDISLRQNGYDNKTGNPNKPLFSKNHHPTVKPIALMKYIIKLLAPPNNPTLLDPFAGSGTTILAAKHLDINAIGIEKEEDYYNIAKARIENVQT